MGIKTANITDASNIPTNEVIGILYLESQNNQK